MDPEVNSQGIHALLANLHKHIENNRNRGTAFEHVIKNYLSNDPLYKSRFKKVSLWSEWEHKWGPDCGIDLVAEDYEGECTAIQCKFYQFDYSIQKSDIDSFFTESGRRFEVSGAKKSFIQRIIVSTSDNWSTHAEASLNNQTIGVTRIHVRDLEQSPIDWNTFDFDRPASANLRPKKTLRPHQLTAINEITKGFKEHDRGKLVMACGTGKTLTALRLAEKVASNNGIVLFLVPSISLLSQTLREWTAESESQFHAFAVCSDNRVGKYSEDISRHDLAIPATTDAAGLIEGFKLVSKKKKMTVIFSTYQSINVLNQAQKKGLPEFDIAICDEAHRTTGVTLAGEEESHFVKVHDQKFIKASKRLYMTATPRIFGEAAKSKADQAGAELCSMDDKVKFGPEFHRLGFGEAVSNGLLADYKVLVLAVDERLVDKNLQKHFASEDFELPLEDIAKIIGCWNGLSKKFVGEGALLEDSRSMRRAVAFARSIKDSKQVASGFQTVVDEYVKNHPVSDVLKCEVSHVDGTFNVLDRNAKLDWLKDEAEEDTCRILSNARCLSEGVDVPALDAVLFLNPRDSMVDVVQSVGRIMRKAEGKKYGYVILPVGIPGGMPPEEALKDNKKYKVIWQVLQALRAHDDRFNATINKIELNKQRPDAIQVIGVGGGSNQSASESGKISSLISLGLPNIEEWKDAIYARIVIKCGTRPYWENWASDVAKIAERHNDHIKRVLKNGDEKASRAFKKFITGLHKTINPSITEADAVEMLSQHLITKPVFDALFEHYPFTQKNPVSQAMQGLLKVIESDSFNEDKEKLKPFYESIKLRVKGIDNAEGRQRIIVELYDRFFKIAFPKMSERLGIVYTPVEVVDFIIKSVEVVLQNEFKQSLSDENVNVLDPFTGTGTFMVRLIQSGIIKPQDMRRKFAEELHANEIVLLAYYIAAINIEETFHSTIGGDYAPFTGVVLTDTFQLGEIDPRVGADSSLTENGERVEKQRKLPIQVVISNPPYSVGQSSANDNNQNLSYPGLDSRIRDTYAALSAATNKNSLYDSYIRGIRWATDRIKGKGVVGYVTNGSFIDSNSADGLRKSLCRDFSKIYCYNLRGNQRTSGELSRQEGGKIFGSGSRTPVAITIFVKDPEHVGECELYYHDIGDYLSREEKLNKIRAAESISALEWTKLKPNEDGDWINQRNPEFDSYLQIGDKESGRSDVIFDIYSRGVATSRDAWCYNFSNMDLEENMSRMISFYNSEVRRFQKAATLNRKTIVVDDFVNNDPTKISWNRGLKKDLSKKRFFQLEKTSIYESSYRPFTKEHLYLSKTFNDMTYQVAKLFPTQEHQNIVFSVTGIGASKPFSTYITDSVPNLHLVDTGQCFPLYFYEKSEEVRSGKTNRSVERPDKYGYIRKHAVSDFALAYFNESYGDANIGKDDIFYYVYGILHSRVYRNSFQNDLKKVLPRIPLVKNFWGFSNSGRELAKLHLNYEHLPFFRGISEENSAGPKSKSEQFFVNEAGMRFSKNGKNEDRTTIIYNNFVTLRGIPLEVYDYHVNGKSPIEWIMERYRVTTDKDSGIRNDPNKWSKDPRYIIDLLKRVVFMSVETSRIVAELPSLELILNKSGSAAVGM